MSNNAPVVLDFEKKIMEIEDRIKTVTALAKDSDVNIDKELNRLQLKLEKQIKLSYANLTPWQKVQIARHPNRPQCLDYIKYMIEDFVELSGDRAFADDPTMIGGIGFYHGIAVVVIGQEKGFDLETRVKYNFGMAKPEGYRKAQRLMNMADKFNMPVICFVDTDGAYPGVESEARGQAEAIASSIQKCLQISVPLISVVIGMGGSGGAIAIAAANRILMLENSIYSVISPEGCASILWRSADKAKEAAEALKLTAQDLMGFGVIDEIISEPVGGAHRDSVAVMEKTDEAVFRHLQELSGLSREELKKQRFEKIYEMGRHIKTDTAKG
ncbi:MAG: acetyl-CoA carboxylase carboxyltransferase subunit alpha [Alphaproteobacteria bacterium]|nr:acetyl-CoA carboxylase carboxyltransferase subunit alpha [Alphaproteobacteria bacterium]